MAYGGPDFGAYKRVVRRVDLTIPAGTAEATPSSTTISLNKGELRRIDIMFPPGAAALAFVRISEGATDVLPTTAGEWISWDDLFVSFPIQYGVTADATTFTIEGYNDDATYPHTVTLHFIEWVER